MLRQMRRNAKSWVVKVVFFVIIVVFSFWGIGSMTANKRNVIATVNGTTISFNEYNDAYDRLVQRYQRQFKDSFNAEMAKQLKLKEQALNSLIDRQLLLGFARRYKLSVTDAELRQRIATMAAFQRHGTFDQELYRRLLSYNRMTPAEFEDSLRDDLLLDKVSKIIGSGAKTTDAEIDGQLAQRWEKISLKLAKFDPRRFTDEISLNDVDLPAYFQAHREKFRVPEKRQAVVIRVPAAEVRKEIKIDEAQLKSYYDDHVGDYVVPERVKARHILFKVEGKAPASAWEEARKKALEVIAKLDQGRDFAALAKEYSQGPSAPRGGELGWFSRGRMVKSFEDAAFALKPGSYTREPVRTQFGYHVILVEKHEKARTKSFAEVKEDIRRQLVNEQLPEVTKEKLAALKTKLAKVKAADFAARARELGLKVIDTGLFAKKDNLAALNNNPAVNQRIFATGAGQLGEVVDPQRDNYLFMVLKVEKSYLPEYQQVKKEVEQAYRLEKARELVKEKAAAMLKQLLAAKEPDLARLAPDFKAEVLATPLFARGSGFVPKIGFDKQISNQVFALDQEHPLYPQPLTYQDLVFLVQLQEKKLDLPQGADVKQLRDNLRRELLNYRRYQAINDLRQHLRQQAEITVSPRFTGE
ncbi:MAG: SurA N-terminal domain-containing protein [Deltaproteobacteria bacterium]|nr:SurA N-terminal domain-containing protein [Deltaproteobacteria bacterium]